MENEQARNAEECLAGAILVDAACLVEVPPELQESDFLSEPCAAVYAAARALQQRQEPVTMTNILEWASIHGRTLPVRTARELMEVTPGCHGAGSYARIIRESSLRRQLQRALLGGATDSTTPLSDLAAGQVQYINGIVTQARTNHIRTAVNVPFEEPRWVLAPYFQRGKGTLVQADPGTGKTAFMCAIAAAVSTGREILGLPVQCPGDVVIASTEDDMGVLRGRLEASGADLEKVHFMEHPETITLQSPLLEQSIQQVQAKLLVLDPLQSFLGSKVDLFRANETRPILSQLFAMCERNDCACAIIAHLGKVTQGKSAVNQSLGSVDIPGVMRSVLHLVRDPSDAGTVHAVHIKSSNAVMGKTIAFRIGERGGVTFTGLSDLTLRSLQQRSEEGPSTDSTVLIPALLELAEQAPQDTVHTYDALGEACRKKLHYTPFTTNRTAARMLEDPALQQRLQADHGIHLVNRVHTHTHRGFRLYRKDPAA